MKLDDIEKAEREATVPPWSVDRYVVNADGEEVSVIADDAETPGPIIATVLFDEATNARAITALRNAAPHLLAVARAAQAATGLHGLCCMHTKNPCGTDTWAIGYDCTCSSCQTWLSLRAALAALEAA